MLGLAFDKDGLLASKRMSEGQRRGLMSLLERFKARTLNTRSPELKAKSSEHDAFIEELRRAVVGEADASGEADARRGAGYSMRTVPESARQPNGATATARTVPGPDGAICQRAAAGVVAATPGVTAPRPAARPKQAHVGPTVVRRGRGWTWTASPTRGLRPVCGVGLRNYGAWTFGNSPTPPTISCGRSWSVRSRSTSQPRASRCQPSMLGQCIEELARAYQNDRRMTSLINAINRRGRMHANQFAGTALSLNASNHEPDSFVYRPERSRGMGAYQADPDRNRQIVDHR